MIGQGARALAHEVTVRFRAQRPHERVSAPPGYRAIVAVADTADGPEEATWLVPARQAKAALNPRNRTPSQQLAAGIIPPGWLLHR